MQFDDSWLLDTTDKTMRIAFKIDKRIYEGKSKFQKIDIINTKLFGKTLFLDGKIQSSESDEIIYHESLVHPAMILHPNPKKILIIGGGEGATLREVLKYKSVEKCVMVDIDSELIEICKQYMPEWNKGAFDDERVEVIIQDGKKYLENCKEKFDVIIMDATDPTENISLHLFSEQFFRLMKSRMNENCVFTGQMGYIDYSDSGNAVEIYKRLRSHFKNIRLSQIFIPSFSFPWSFMTASDKFDPRFDPRLLSKEYIDKKIEERRLDLKHYDSETHLSMYMLPKMLRTLLEKTED